MNQIICCVDFFFGPHPIGEVPEKETLLSRGVFSNGSEEFHIALFRKGDTCYFSDHSILRKVDVEHPNACEIVFTYMNRRATVYFNQLRQSRKERQ